MEEKLADSEKQWLSRLAEVENELVEAKRSLVEETEKNTAKAQETRQTILGLEEQRDLSHQAVQQLEEKLSCAAQKLEASAKEQASLEEQLKSAHETAATRADTLKVISGQAFSLREDLKRVNSSLCEAKADFESLAQAATMQMATMKAGVARQLAESESRADELLVELNQMNAELKKRGERVASLQSTLTEAEEKRKELADEVERLKKQGKLHGKCARFVVVKYVRTVYSSITIFYD
jgi:DNA repair exonuclease SbcCD ATPase subunit